jgi:hypothetical protein
MIYLLMHTLQIDASPHQLRKLKKGLMVRIKKGTGFELLVHPTTYNIVSRAFNKGKGSQVKLSPEELEMNQAISKAISPEAHGIAQAGTSMPVRTLAASGPALAPSPMTGGKIGRVKKANKWQTFVDSTLRDTIDTGGKAGRVYNDTTSPMARMGFGIGCGISSDANRHLNQALNEQLGHGYGRLARAGMDNYLNSQNSALMTKHGIDARRGLIDAGHGYDAFASHSRMNGGAIEKSTVGLKGSMLHAYMPPALVSQPFSANFQFQHFLPVQFQHFNSGGAYNGNDIMGNGLYV